MMRTGSSRIVSALAAGTLAVLGIAAPSLASAQATVVVDNSSPGFYRTGYWWSSTLGPPFVGPDHLVATAPSEAQLIDNASPRFSTTGSWTTATDPPGYYGPNFARSVTRPYPAPIHLPEIVIDNATSGKGGNTLFGAFYSSHWLSSTALPGYYGRDYLYYAGPNGVEPTLSFQFNLRGYANLGNSATMVLYAHWPADPQNASNAVIRVRNASGATVAQFVVNQRIPSGTWAPLGPVVLTPATTYYVEFDATRADGRVIADAIRLATQDASPPNVAKWTLPGGLYGSHDVYARWPSSSQFETFVGWTVVGGDGSDFPISSNNISQKQGGGQWLKQGTIDVSGSQPNHVLLEQFDAGSQAVAADAVLVVPQGSFPTAVWPLRVAGPVKLYATWSADPSRSSSARYVVYSYQLVDGYPGPSCSRTTTGVSVDQRSALGSAGYLLGTFASNPACAPMTVTLMPDATGGTLSADSIRAEPAVPMSFAAGQLFMPAGSQRAGDGVTLAYQPDGNLVVNDATGARVWTSNAPPRACSAATCFALFQDDGHLVLYQNGAAYWYTGIQAPGGRMTVSPVDPFINVYTQGGTITYTSSRSITASRGAFTVPGASTIRFAEGAFVAYQNDGNFVVYDRDSRPLWSARTSGRNCTPSACVAIFQGDGNFVLYENGVPYWASGTNGAFLTFSRTFPPAAILNDSGQTIWSGTSP